MDKERFTKQLDFIIEIDKVKNILRKTRLFDDSKYENDAEHSWTICIMASLLREYSNFEVNIEKVMLMLLIHDIVEIDAGDTFLYAESRDSAHIDEEIAAKRIFGILPDDQAKKYLELWNEFEGRETNESKFASTFDRIEPIIQNYKTGGHSWKEHGITKDMVIAKNQHAGEGSKEIWNFILHIIDLCVEKGYLKE